MKKKILFILGILIFCDIFYFSYVNSGLSVDFNYKPFIQSFEWDNGVMFFVMSLYAALGTYLLCYGMILNYKEKLKHEEKFSQKASLATEESSDKIKLLESKIKTLESALRDALDENSD